MARYVFSNGKVTIEEGVYLPLLRDEKSKRRGVLIVVQTSRQTTEPEKSTQEKELPRDH